MSDELPPCSVCGAPWAQECRKLEQCIAELEARIDHLTRLCCEYDVDEDEMMEQPRESRE